MEVEELIMIKAGSVSGTIINAIVRSVTLALELGRSLGSAIRRTKEKKKCTYSQRKLTIFYEKGSVLGFLWLSIIIEEDKLQKGGNK